MTATTDPSQDLLRPFLEAEKADPGPPVEVQQRIFSRLAGTLAFDPGVPPAPPPSAPPTSAPPGPLVAARVAHGLGHGLGRAMATFLVGAAVGATTYGTVQHLASRPSATIRPAVSAPALAPGMAPEPAAPRPPEPAVTVPVAPALVRPRPAGQAGAGDSRDARAAKDGGAVRDDCLAAERRLLEIARTALGRGRTDGALATLRQHARLFPSGQLAEERESLLVQALVAKGDYGQARERATRFHRQHPHSLFAPVVEQALQSIP